MDSGGAGALQPDARRTVPLSAREREAVDLVAAGFTLRAAAERMGVSVSTLRGHLLCARLKLGFRDGAAFRAWARETTEWPRA